MVAVLAVHAAAIAAYRRKDGGTGRCRLPSALFEQWGLKTGWVLHLKVAVPGMEFTCLCTAWPDTLRAMADGHVCIDDSVIVTATWPGPEPGAEAGHRVWVEGRCEVVHAAPPSSCRSFHTHAAPEERLHAAAFLGLAVAPGTWVRANGRTRRHAFKVMAIAISGGGGSGAKGQYGANSAAVVHMGTIVLPAAVAPAIAPATAATTTAPTSKTAVVVDLLHRVIMPALHLPRQTHLAGVLLLGPPGVGKTYAVKALQALCAIDGLCRVRIREVSIPDVLAADDPLALLAAALAPIEEAGDKVAEPSNGGGGFGGGGDGATPLKHVAATTPLKPVPAAVSGSAVRTPHKWNLSSPSSVSKAKTPDTSSSAPRGDGSGGGGGVGMSSLPAVTLVVIDEVDALGTSTAQSAVQAAVKQHLCAWFDRRGEGRGARVCVVATSNRPADVDTRLRRGGRLEREIDVMASASDRARLIETQLLALFRMNGGGSGESGGSEGTAVPTRQDINEAAGIVAEKTGGYVAADVNALVSEARTHLAATRVSATAATSVVAVLVGCFDRAMRAVGPSSLRGIAVHLPALTYDDVIGCTETKKILRRVLSFSGPGMRDRVRRFGLRAPGGVLLHGPPGNSKTRLVLAAAAAHGLPVISLSAADVYSPYVGDAEAEIRKVCNSYHITFPIIPLLTPPPLHRAPPGISGRAQRQPVRALP